jgi:hypothetical protein
MVLVLPRALRFDARCRANDDLKWGGDSIYDIVDFTDTSNPVEIGYFDRGPTVATTPPASPSPGGFWSTYWYNGEAYGSELARNFDVMGLTPNEQQSANEIAAAREVQVDRLNVQRQDRFTWEPSFAVARSFLDQAFRADAGSKTLGKVDAAISRAEGFADNGLVRAAAAELASAASMIKHDGLDGLSDALRALADSYKEQHGG